MEIVYNYDQETKYKWFILVYRLPELDIVAEHAKADTYCQVLEDGHEVQSCITSTWNSF